MEVMMVKILTTLSAIFAFLSVSAFAAAPTKMNSDALDQVVAGTGDCGCPPPEGKVKGNNGWGNGADPTNPGSDNGATAASKIGFPAGTGGNLISANKINTNPTGSTGR